MRIWTCSTKSIVLEQLATQFSSHWATMNAKCSASIHWLWSTEWVFLNTVTIDAQTKHSTCKHGFHSYCWAAPWRIVAEPWYDIGCPPSWCTDMSLKASSLKLNTIDPCSHHVANQRSKHICSCLMLDASVFWTLSDWESYYLTLNDSLLSHLHKHSIIMWSP